MKTYSWTAYAVFVALVCLTGCSSEAQPQPQPQPQDRGEWVTESLDWRYMHDEFMAATPEMARREGHFLQNTGQGSITSRFVDTEADGMIMMTWLRGYGTPADWAIVFVRDGCDEVPRDVRKVLGQSGQTLHGLSEDVKSWLGPYPESWKFSDGTYFVLGCSEGSSSVVMRATEEGYQHLLNAK